MAINTPINSFIFGFYVLLSSLILYFDIAYNKFEKVKNSYNAVVISSNYIIDKNLESISFFYKSFQNNQSLLRENQNLSYQLDQLKVENFLLKNFDMYFNDFYKKDMLETFSSVSNRVYISQIASFDTDNYFCCTNHELILNNFEGIPKDLIANRPVISKSGIVGQAYDVINDSIKVILLSDARHITPLKSGDFFCNAKGVGRPNLLSCSLNTLIHQNKLEIGDLFYTSGMGGVFPVNILIGELVAINKVDDNEYLLEIYLYQSVINENVLGILIDE